MKDLKGHVRNKARPEGSIAEAYLTDECITFCSRYLHGVETIFNRPERNEDRGEHSSKPHILSIFPTSGRPLGKAKVKELEDKLWNAATLYVLHNCNEAEPYVQ